MTPPTVEARNQRPEDSPREGGRRGRVADSPMSGSFATRQGYTDKATAAKKAVAYVAQKHDMAASFRVRVAKHALNGEASSGWAVDAESSSALNTPRSGGVPADSTPGRCAVCRAPVSFLRC